MRIGVEASARRNQAGTGVLLAHLLEQLRARGHQVIEFSHATRNLPPPLAGEGRGGGFVRVRNGLRQILWTQLALPRLARRSRVDVLLCPAYVGPLVSPVPLVLMILDVTFLMEPQTGDRLYMRYLGALVPPLARRARRIVTISKSAAADIARLLPGAAGKIDVAYPGPGQGTGGSRATPARSRFVLMVGTLEPRKNYPRAIEAFALLRRDSPDWCLRIAGGVGWAAQGIPALIDRLGLTAAVELMGHVPADTLAALYREAAVLFYPSLYEGFGFPILEAMSAGCPVVTSDRSSMAEIAGDAAVLVDPQDPSAMAAGLRAVLEGEPARREALIAKGLARATEFSWERFGASTEAALLAAVGR